jgi:hypothetical protein
VRQALSRSTSGHDLSVHRANGGSQPGATAAPGEGPSGDAGGAVTVPGRLVIQSGQNLPSSDAARTYELWMKSTASEAGGQQLLSHGGDSRRGVGTCSR